MPVSCVDHAALPLGVEDCPHCITAQRAHLRVYDRCALLLALVQELLEEASFAEAAAELTTLMGVLYAGYQQPLEAWLDFQHLAPEERQQVRARATMPGWHPRRHWTPPQGWHTPEAS